MNLQQIKQQAMDAKEMAEKAVFRDELVDVSLMVPSLTDNVLALIEEVEKIQSDYRWLIRHAWMSVAISKAKAAELLGCSLIDFDEVMNEVQSR